MQIEMEPNPNCQESVQFVFNELEAARPISGIRAGDEGKEFDCDVIGVEEGGQWVPAQAIKIADSSDGIAYLIYGGAWGIRIRPASHSKEPWDVSNRSQWGEPFKIYGNPKDIFYAG